VATAGNYVPCNRGDEGRPHWSTKHPRRACAQALTDRDKVNSERAVQFRKWATRVVEEFTIKGFAMDDERMKRGGSVLSDRYFEEQLQRVREIRLSERKFYQKITDIYATSVDYDVTAQATKRLFATVQNKLHWAIHGQTAAEVIVDRADADGGRHARASGPGERGDSSRT